MKRSIGGSQEGVQPLLQGPRRQDKKQQWKLIKERSDIEGSGLVGTGGSGGKQANQPKTEEERVTRKRLVGNWREGRKEGRKERKKKEGERKREGGKKEEKKERKKKEREKERGRKEGKKSGKEGRKERKKEKGESKREEERREGGKEEGRKTMKELGNSRSRSPLILNLLRMILSPMPILCILEHKTSFLLYMGGYGLFILPPHLPRRVLVGHPPPPPHPSASWTFPSHPPPPPGVLIDRTLEPIGPARGWLKRCPPPTSTNWAGLSSLLHFQRNCPSHTHTHTHTHTHARTHAAPADWVMQSLSPPSGKGSQSPPGLSEPLWIGTRAGKEPPAISIQTGQRKGGCWGYYHYY
ncbi:nst1, partial [Ophiophagus hannah]